MKINCPKCQQEYSVDESYFGKTVQCQQCNYEFMIESPKVSAHLRQTQKLKKNFDEETKQVEVSFSANGTRKCPYCQKDVEKEAVACPYCHGSFVSTNRFLNAIGMIIVFLVLYWLISSFVSCETDREMKKIEQQVETIFKKGDL